MCAAGYPPVVARETDRQRLQALRAAFADTASNVPEFSRTASTGGHCHDEGLRNLLAPEFSEYEQRLALKSTVVAALDAGYQPTIERSRGDADMHLDAACYYHFRVTVCGVRLFVKVFCDEESPELDVIVVSVKRDDQAWK